MNSLLCAITRTVLFFRRLLIYSHSIGARRKRHSKSDILRISYRDLKRRKYKKERHSFDSRKFTFIHLNSRLCEKRAPTKWKLGLWNSNSWYSRLFRAFRIDGNLLLLRLCEEKFSFQYLLFFSKSITPLRSCIPFSFNLWQHHCNLV